MTDKNRASRWLGGVALLGLVVTTLLVALRVVDPGPVRSLRLLTFDLYQRLEPRASGPLPVVIVDIDEKSLEAYGQWPWPRTLLASLTHALGQMGVAVIGFDFIFPEADRMSPDQIADSVAGIDEDTRAGLRRIKSNDEVFGEVIAVNNVVMGRMSSPSESLEAPAVEAKLDIVEQGGSVLNLVPSLPGLVTSLPVLESGANGAGVLTALPEFDGIVRRVPTLLQVGDSLHPAFGLELLRVMTRQNMLTVIRDPAGVQQIDLMGIRVDTDQRGRSWVHYNKHNPARFISAGDVLAGTVDIAELAGRIVLVGTSAAGLLDVKPTPMGQTMPGVEIWAQWLESILLGDPLIRPNYVVTAEYLATAGICLLLVILLARVGAVISLVVVLAALIGQTAFSWRFYTDSGILFDTTFSIVAAMVVFLVLVFFNYFKEERQRRQIRNAFTHYLSPEIVEELAANPDSLRLGGENRHVTFLFTDVAGFTSLAEVTEPETLVALVNEYLERMCQIVLDHGGTIDKIIGDAVVAMFGAPGQLPDHAAKAVDCAVAMDRFGNEFSNQKRAEGLDLGITRIGVYTGDAIVGNFGGSARFDYTAYGDTINTAARFESVNKHLGTRVCVATTTVAECPEEYPFRPVADLVLKGKTESITAFEPLTGEELNSPRIQSYLAAYEKMKVKDGDAAALFATLLAEYPDDPVVALHHRRLEDGSVGTKMTMDEK